MFLITVIFIYIRHISSLNSEHSILFSHLNTMFHGQTWVNACSKYFNLALPQTFWFTQLQSVGLHITLQIDILSDDKTKTTRISSALDSFVRSLIILRLRIPSVYQPKDSDVLNFVYRRVSTQFTFIF